MGTSVRFWAAMVLLFAGHSVNADHPLGLDKNHPYGRLTIDYVTPHVAWANPYSRGKLRALVIAPTWSQRETVELAQRLSLDFTPWMSASFHQFAFSPQSDPAAAFFLVPPEVVQRAGVQALKKEYDVVLIGKVLWSAIPAKQRFEILRKVAGGAGLVYVNPPADDKELDLVFRRRATPDNEASITANLPLASLPRFREIDRSRLVRCHLFGEGRVVVLDYQEPPIPADQRSSTAWPCLTPQWDLSDNKERFQPLASIPEAEFVPYEYYQALVARAVLWAGKKEPETALKPISLDEKLSWPVAGKAATIDTVKSPAGATVRACVRSRTDGSTTPLRATDAKASVQLVLPDLMAGDYFLDVWLLTAGGKSIIIWGSSAFSVTADGGIGSITLERNAYNPGDSIGGAVGLSRPLLANERVSLGLYDNFGRLIESTNLKVSGNSGSFRLGQTRPMTILHRVEATISRDGKAISSTHLDFPIRARRGWDDFNDIVWSSGENNFLTHLMLRKLAGEDETTAIDIGWRGNTCARNIALANLAAVPYTARYGCLGAGPDHIVPENSDNAYGCMSSPVTLANLDRWGDVQSDIYGPYGPLAWTHGDETNYAYDNPNLCWSKTCLAAFRERLKSVYPSLRALNQEWKTGFANWDAVTPITFAEAKESKVYARWVEHRLSCNHVFAQFYHRSGEALSKHDPDARAGFDGGVGLTRPNSGGDWWTLSREISILHSYIGNSDQMEISRSFAHPKQVRGMWYGTYGLTWQIGPNTPTYCHFFPWYSLFHQMNTTWFWTMGSPGPLSGYAPDLMSLPFFESRTDALKQIRSGIGKLLLASVRDNDRIAIHHSEVSRIADSLFAAKESDWSSAYAAAVADFNKALEDSGLQYKYLSTDEVEDGALIRSGYRVFIMPHSRAVSDAEAQEIRQFAQQGGVVIADVLAGVLNGHGSPQGRSLLADIFPSDTAGTTTTVGEGESILIGDLLKGYARAHTDMFGWKRLPLEKSRELATLLRDHAKIIPPITIAPLKGDAIPPTEIAQFHCGAVTFASLLREYFLYDNAEYPVRVEFPKPTHIYDVLSGKYLGKTDRVDTSVSYRAKLYALSPYKVTGMELTAPTTAAAGNPVAVQISVKADAGVKPSRHGLRLEVSGPDEHVIPWYSQNLLGDEGRANANIPLAFNDPPGDYTVSVRDVMSGVTAQRKFGLK